MQPALAPSRPGLTTLLRPVPGYKKNTVSDIESDNGGCLSEENPETGYRDGPQDKTALATNSCARTPRGIQMTPTIPPSFDGVMSWFEYEQLVDDWVALTTIEPARRGPLLKTWPTGLAKKNKKLLDNSLFRDPDSCVEHFKKTLRPYFVKGNQHVYFRFWHLFKTWRGQKDYLMWITGFEIVLTKLESTWMDLLPVIEISDPQLANAAQPELEYLQARTPAEQYAVLEDLHKEVLCSSGNGSRKTVRRQSIS